LTGKPLVEGQDVEVTAMRSAKPSQVAALVVALKKAKAKSAIVKTETRDKVMAPLPLYFASSVPDCSTVAYIAKDASVNVWNAGGSVAKRVTKGFAGPDMTLGTAAVRAATNTGCESTILLVAADDMMIWGLVFDLVTISKQTTDAGPPLHASSTVLLTTPPVPGRKVTLD
jgi:hypothetical protein